MPRYPLAGVTEFIKLLDTPAAYSGQAGKVPAVNTGETALEYATRMAGVKVRKNYQMPIIGTRPQLNMVEGAAIDISILDNPPDDEIDIVIGSKVPTRFMTLIPEDASLPVANPAAKATVDGANFAYDVLDFDQATEETANWEWFLTPDYEAENIVVDIYWVATPAAGDVMFGFSVLGRVKGEAWDAALGTERTVIQTTNGAGLLNRARITTFSPNWAAGDVVLFKLARKAADGLDTLAADARVVKVVVSYTGQFAQAFYPLPTPILLTKPVQGAWGDIDISAYAPVGATGAILHIVNDYTSSVPFGLRKKGSTDDRHTRNLATPSHTFPMIGIDENRVFQLYYSGNGDFEVYLTGYTGTGVVFFDNAYEKTIHAVNAWTDVDCSAQIPSDAIGVILEVAHTGGGNQLCAFRKNGSTDDRYSGTYKSLVPPLAKFWTYVGVDSSQIYEQKIGGDAFPVYLIGYIFEGAVFKTNADDISPVGGGWTETDLTTEAPSGIMAFIEMTTWGASYYGGIRKHGSTEETSRPFATQIGICALDSGQKCDIAAGMTPPSVGFHLIGYAQWAGA